MAGPADLAGDGIRLAWPSSAPACRAPGLLQAAVMLQVRPAWWCQQCCPCLLGAPCLVVSGAEPHGSSEPLLLLLPSLLQAPPAGADPHGSSELMLLQLPLLLLPPAPAAELQALHASLLATVGG